MTNKVVDITILKLDVTQLTKIREYLTNDRCNQYTYQGAYLYELRELVDTILQSVYLKDERVITAPSLTI